MKNYWNVKPIKIHLNLDSDRDGVKDWKDCRPFDAKLQHEPVYGNKKYYSPYGQPNYEYHPERYEKKMEEEKARANKLSYMAKNYKKIIDNDDIEGNNTSDLVKSLPWEIELEENEQFNRIIQYAIKKLPEEVVARLIMNRNPYLQLDFYTVKALLEKTEQPIFLIRFLLNANLDRSQEGNIHELILSAIKKGIKQTRGDERGREIIIDILQVFIKKSYLTKQLKKEIDELVISLTNE